MALTAGSIHGGARGLRRGIADVARSVAVSTEGWLPTTLTRGGITQSRDMISITGLRSAISATLSITRSLVAGTIPRGSSLSICVEKSNNRRNITWQK